MSNVELPVVLKRVTDDIDRAKQIGRGRDERTNSLQHNDGNHSDYADHLDHSDNYPIAGSAQAMEASRRPAHSSQHTDYMDHNDVTAGPPHYPHET